MKKSSKHLVEITESRWWWECGMDTFAEWTFEGDLKDDISVGVTGNRTRYQSGVYDST